MQKRSNTLVLGLAASAAFVLAGCDVQKTQEGSVNLPKYEVQKTQEGNVNLPKYDVTAPDVNIEKTQKEVTVPKVTTEKETITVPKVDIKTGQEKAAEGGSR
jgi:uncharacterized lipoprotein